MIFLTPQAFLEKAATLPVVDVRSPKEFANGHIPQAQNIPIFNDEERKIVGTLYKHSGRDISVMKGLEMIGPKLVNMASQAVTVSKNKEIMVHCWRGGLRSQNMAWLFEQAGLKVYFLKGGYKAFRRYIRQSLGEFSNVIILGGKTGSGKTDILENIKSTGFQIINLEKLACHKGSAFGDLGQDEQPANEQFENDLYSAFCKLDPEKSTWIEDESRAIGRISIPDTFFNLMRNSTVYFVDVPKVERIKRLVEEYEYFPKNRLISGIERISKRLGGLNTRRALEALETNDYKIVADILLIYYDKAYLKGLSFRDQSKVVKIQMDSDNPAANARAIINSYKTSNV